MNNGLKKFLSIVLSAIMIFSSVTFVNMSIVMADSSSYILEEGGWLESAYVEWTSVPNATGFAAYVKKADEADSSYVKLDNELIRKYPTYFRVDAVGLSAGQYVIKVVPYINGALDESAAFVSGTLDVKAYDRSGSAFSSKSPFYGKGVGAYNNNGTLKSDAQVLYITKDTAKTVKADIITNKNGTTTEVTGMQAIIDAKQKGLDTRPLDFRIIGTIDKNNMDSFSSSAEGLQVKGKNAGAELNITIEGIGEDAGIRGFGILCRNVGNVELRNFGIMLCMDDAISIDTNNDTLWVHNMDLFYGSTGGDADQAKGDGTVDVKGKSTRVTVSYNHFWDSGKSSLCGMGSEVTSSHITYHHNWFDHSDSRHPRIRVQSVHIYNNYFDGNSKYGVGVTLGSSAFVESNYFRNCKHPMMSSKQGSDIMENDKTGVADFSGKGTFSGEAGGVIKAYNNHIEGSDADKFNGGVEPVYYDATATGNNGKATQYDAYLATTRTEKVPETVKALSGGSSYNNFDTDTANFDLGVDEANITAVEDVPAVVTKYAGRVNGGDFKNDTNKYTVLNDDKSYAVDTVLKSALISYTPSLVSVGGIDAGGEVDTTVSTETTTEVTTEKVSETTTEKVTETTTINETSSETTTENVNPEPDFVYGDVDGSGKRNISDVNLLIEQIRMGAVNVINGINDVNSDGVVDTADVATLLQKVLHDSFKMPCEPTSSEPTTEATTATTEATTIATTELTTESTTVEPTTELVSFDDKYDFENNPEITKDGTSGITYTVSTKSQTSDNLTAETIIADFGGSKTLLLNDKSATDAVKAVVPVTIKNKGITTYTLNITPTEAKGNWTVFMLDGVKADGTEGEVLGLRIDKSKNYGLRVNGGSAVTSSNVAVVANTTVNVVIIVDFDNDTATLSVNDSTPVTVTGVDAKSIKSMSFQTATDARSLYVDNITTAGGSYDGEIVESTETTEETTGQTTEATTEETTGQTTEVTTEKITEQTTEATTEETTEPVTSLSSSWTAGDTVPSWLGVSGSAENNSKSYVAFENVNGSAFEQTVKIATNGTFTITPEKAGTVKVYIAADNNNANKGNVTATVNNATIGTYSLPSRKDSAATAFELTVDDANVGKVITFTTSYKALLFKAEFN